jgi:GNAT superfamily N-acetyltransferase
MSDKLAITTDPDERDVDFLEERIVEFNYERTGVTDGVLLASFVRDGTGAIEAGIYGWTWGGTCEIENLWVREGSRGRGLGRQLLLAAEEEARRRGCRQMVLDTHSFQAPGFYLKMGFAKKPGE